jgi:hypothetical protein
MSKPGCDKARVYSLCLRETRFANNALKKRFPLSSPLFKPIICGVTASTTNHLWCSSFNHQSSVVFQLQPPITTSSVVFQLHPPITTSWTIPCAISTSHSRTTSPPRFSTRHRSRSCDTNRAPSPGRKTPSSVPAPVNVAQSDGI